MHVHYALEELGRNDFASTHVIGRNVQIKFQDYDLSVKGHRS